LADLRTRKRETDALSEAMAELRQTTGTIVTRDEAGQMDTDAGSVEIVPAWRFLLNLPDSGNGDRGA
jgi:predicted AAA+ superfamily ATPase